MELWSSREERESYKKEHEGNTSKAWTASKKDGLWALFASAGTLSVGLFALHHYQASDGLMISVTIALAALCLIGTINMRTAALEADVIYVSGAIEWFGNKLLQKEPKVRR